MSGSARTLCVELRPAMALSFERMLFDCGAGVAADGAGIVAGADSAVEVSVIFGSIGGGATAFAGAVGASAIAVVSAGVADGLARTIGAATGSAEGSASPAADGASRWPFLVFAAVSLASFI